MKQKNIVLAASVREYNHALALANANGMSVGHICYGISSCGRLLRDKVLSFIQGGVAIVSDSYRGCQIDGKTFDSRRLASEITAEAVYRGFDGVFADFEGSMTPSMTSLVCDLDRELTSCGISLYVNARYAQYTDNGIVVVSSQVTGGSFSVYLSELKKKYAPKRLAIELIPLCMDFLLPCASGSGRCLTESARLELMEKVAPLPFYSQELSARYFTYMADDRHAHFVLYDDARTIASKLLTAHKAGIEHAFMLYGELGNWVADIMSATRESCINSADFS